MTFRSICFQVADWSLEDWNVDLTAGLFDRLDFDIQSGMFWWDLNLEPLNFGTLSRSSQQWYSIKKYRNIHRKKSVLESLFTKVLGFQACNFIKKRL